MSRFPVLSVCAALVLGLVWLSVASPLPVSAASATAATDLELRSSPAPDAPVAAVVPAGSPLSLDGPPEGDSYPVTFEGTSGWVPASGLIVTKDDPPEAVPDSAVPESAAPEPTVLDITEPPVLPVVPTAEPTAVPLPAPAPPVDSTVAPLAPAAPPPTVAATFPASGSEVPSPSAVMPDSTEVPAAPTEVLPTPTEGAPASIERPSPTVPPVPTATPTPVPEVRGPATASVNLALLANPQRGSAVLFNVPAGSTLTRTGSFVNGFVSADFMGIAGWADFDLLAEPLPTQAEAEPTPTLAAEIAPTALPTAEPLPTTAPSPTATPVPTVASGVGGPGSGLAYASSDLSLRSGPSAAYPELSTIGAGESMALTGVMEDGFVRVEYGGQIGWVATSNLNLPVDPTPVTAPRGTASKRVFSREEIIRVIYAAADRFEQPRADMLRVAECESSLDPYAVNASGSYGLFQFVASTWESTPYANKDVFDPKANANAAAWMWSVGRRNEWVCQ